MAADDPTKAALPTDAQAPSRLFIQFDGHAPSEHGSKWNELYEQDYIPWDKGFPGPAFVDLLTEREDLLGPSFVVDPAQGQRRKKALVAGCGKGYDVLLLSAFGYDAYGLEISELALKAARESEKNLLGEEVYKVRDEAVGRGKITWLSGDFFKEESFKSVGGKGSFDLLYDYTFLCALPPVLRPAWSKQVNWLLAPAGRLVCLEFPTYKSPKAGGPPWALPPKIYEALLPRPGKELPYDDDGELDEKKLGPESEDGLVRLEHFQPKRTHEIGIDADGKITDWVGVWAHEAAPFLALN